MRAIIGIGNPGNNYQLNRHNIGILTLTSFAITNKLKFAPSKYDYDYLEGDFSSNSFILVKPTTYVNKSGIAVKQVIEKYNIVPEDVLVIVDDINLKKFDFRLKKSGSDGGHKGLASIIYHCNSNSFPRLRIGIGNDFNKGELSNYVLSNFTDDELIVFENLFPIFLEIILSFILGGYKSALSTYSKSKEKIKKT